MIIFERFKTPAIPCPELATGNDNHTICTVPDEDRTLEKGHKDEDRTLEKGHKMKTGPLTKD